MKNFLPRLFTIILASLLVILSIQPVIASPMASATLTMPSVSTLSGQTVAVSVSLDPAGGNVYGIDLRLTFDPAVASVEAVQTGARTSGWSLAYNVISSGVVLISLAGTSPVAAQWEIVKINFRAANSPGAQTVLTATRCDLNEGAIPCTSSLGGIYIALPVISNFSANPLTGPAPLAVTFTNLSTGDFTSSSWDFGDSATSTSASPTHVYAAGGTYTVKLTVSGIGGTNTMTQTGFIQVYTLSISGQVRYWKSGAGVGGVTLALTGPTTNNVISSADGTYTHANLLAGNYNLVPSKSDEIGAITAYDASLVLQHVVGLITLTGNQAVAADCDGSGIISSLDAGYILEKSVGKNIGLFPGVPSMWKFAPNSLSYTPLLTNKSGQDFTAILLGDPSGNWASGATGPSLAVVSPILTMNAQLPSPDGIVIADVYLIPNNSKVFSYNLSFDFDSNQTALVSAALDNKMSGWIIATNTGTNGVLQVAAAGVQPLSQGGHILQLKFKMNNFFASTPLNIYSGIINESEGAQLSETTLGASYHSFLPIMKHYVN